MSASFEYYPASTEKCTTVARYPWLEFQVTLDGFPITIDRLEPVQVQGITLSFGGGDLNRLFPDQLHVQRFGTTALCVESAKEWETKKPLLESHLKLLGDQLAKAFDWDTLGGWKDLAFNKDVKPPTSYPDPRILVKITDPVWQTKDVHRPARVFFSCSKPLPARSVVGVSQDGKLKIATSGTDIISDSNLLVSSYGILRCDRFSKEQLTEAFRDLAQKILQDDTSAPQTWSLVPVTRFLLQ